MSCFFRSHESGQQRLFQYELYHQIPIQEPWCGILKLNNEKSLLFAAGAMRTLIFQFKKGLKTLCSIREDSQAISNIFTKQYSNSAFIGNLNGTIKIFQTIGINNTKIQIKCKEHKSSITGFVMSKDGSLLITSSMDGNIKFWNFEDSLLCQQTIKSHQGGVSGISLNQSGNQIISCGKQKFILIIEQASFNKRWFVSQKIDLESFGYGICFISENSFAFQCDQDKLLIFQRKKESQLYNQIQEFQVQTNAQNCLFKQQYIPQKSLLISTRGNLISVVKDTEIKLIQNSAVDFTKIDDYGSFSEDGEFLISCDDKSTVISIRQCKLI